MKIGDDRMSKNLKSVFFSATNNTKDLVCRITENLARSLEISNVSVYDFTPAGERNKRLEFTQEDIVVIGVPVYAGRVPNLLLNYIKSMQGNGAICVALVTFGNRNFDDALIELSNIMTNCDFNLISAGAFVYPHSFSNILAGDRPDKDDIELMQKLIDSTALKIRASKQSSGSLLDLMSIRGNIEYRNYFKPVDKNGHVFEFRKIKPHTFNECLKCNICVDLCPMASIEELNPKIVSGKCIKCCACIKSCPVKAKEFIDENYIKHKLELEELANFRVESYVCY